MFENSIERTQTKSRNYIHRWWDYWLPRHIGEVELRAIFPDKEKPTKILFSRNPQKLTDFCLKYMNQGYNIYFGVVTRNKSNSGKKDNLKWLKYLWVDLDNVSEKEMLERLKNVPWPDIIISTGGGYHCYWELDEPIRPTPDDIPEIEGRLKGLVQIVGGDSCHDVTRILRVPGTINYPDEKKRAKGRKTCPVKIVRIKEERLWPV